MVDAVQSISRQDLLERLVHLGALQIVVDDLNRTKAHLEHTSFKVAQDWDAFNAAKGGVSIIEKIVQKYKVVIEKVRIENEDKKKKEQEESSG